jgi:hypothetical protein
VYRAARKTIDRRLARGFELEGRPAELAHYFSSEA